MILYESFTIALRYSVKLAFSQFARNGILGISSLGKHGATLQFSGIILEVGLENPSNDNHLKIKIPARSKTDRNSPQRNIFDAGIHRKN